MGHFGFSYIGLIYLLCLFIPNIIWSRKTPDGYNFEDENKVLLAFERVGQVAVTCSVLIFSDYNPASVGLWNIWLGISIVLLVLYEVCWLRYFRNPTLTNFYKSFFGIPVPLATLPVAAFFLLGIYGKVVWLVLAAVILGIGHLGIHIEHLKKFKNH